MTTLTDIRAVIEEARPARAVAYVTATAADLNRLCDVLDALLERVEELEGK